MPDKKDWLEQDLEINGNGRNFMFLAEAGADLVGAVGVLCLVYHRKLELWQAALMISAYFWFIHKVLYLDEVPEVSKYE